MECHFEVIYLFKRSIYLGKLLKWKHFCLAGIERWSRGVSKGALKFWTVLLNGNRKSFSTSPRPEKLFNDLQKSCCRRKELTRHAIITLRWIQLFFLRKLYYEFFISARDIHCRQWSLKEFPGECLCLKMPPFPFEDLPDNRTRRSFYVCVRPSDIRENPCLLYHEGTYF